MLIETLFLRLVEPDQSEIKEIVQEIVNIHNGAIFKNGTIGFHKVRLSHRETKMFCFSPEKKETCNI